jgi:hypothetical protein
MKRTPLFGLSVLAIAAALVATPLTAGATTGVPDPPTGVAAVAAASQATVSWTPATTGAPATWYRVKATPTMPIPASCGDATSTSCVFTGLANGTSYTFTVIAHNAAGVSLASAPSTPVTPLNHPPAPTSVTATPIGLASGGGDVKVQWSPPPRTGGSPLTGYSVTSSPAVSPPAGCTNILATSCSFNNLTNGVTYTFSVTAANAQGTGPAASATATPAKYFAGGPSSNWSGYASISNTKVTEMSGSWVVPSLKCVNGATTKYTASWVGIGGVSDSNLLQTGTSDICFPDGTQFDFGWFELLPGAESDFTPNENQLPQFQVAPGDVMEGKVYLNANNQWETDLTDVTSGNAGTYIVGVGWTYSAYQGGQVQTAGIAGGTPNSFKGSTSAEWIIEDPSSGTSLLPFPNFQSVTFSDLEVDSGQPVLTDADGFGMFNNNGLLLSAPGDVVGNSFTCTYKPKGLLAPPTASALVPWGASLLATPAPQMTPSIQASPTLRSS